MGRICPPLVRRAPSIDEVSFADLKLTSNERLSISRALRNLNPDSRDLRLCVERSSKRYHLNPDCSKTRQPEAPCDCSSNSSDLSCFCRQFRSKRAYAEEELRRIADAVRAKLDEDLVERGASSGKRKQPRGKDARYCIVPVVVCSSEESASGSSSETTTTTTTTRCFLCACESTSEESLTCGATKALTSRCKDRLNPLVFRHFDDLPNSRSPSFVAEQRYQLHHVGKSEEIGKWGEFLDMVERALRYRDLQLVRIGSCHSVSVRSVASSHKSEMVCCDDVCTMMPAVQRDNFENLDRFRFIEEFGFSTLCRGLMRWSSCTTKRWDCITKNPHLVIHLPSMSFPCHLRCTARKQFEALQNVQIGRLGWLVNEQARLMYIYPGKSNEDTRCVIQKFVSTARPDVDLARLWIIENDDECFCHEVAEEYRSGCESLFYTPSVYRRVRHLTAGRHGFIIPGVLSKTDVLIACELKTAIVGPCLKFQERLLNKHYVMSLLAEAGISRPPFSAVGDFRDLCDKLSEMIIGHPRLRKYLVKVNCGFCGNQSALICLERDAYCDGVDTGGLNPAAKENLSCYLAKILPRKLELSRGAYKKIEDFLKEVEKHGGVLTACPPGDYRTLSLGCFIEHDTAKACLRTAADVLRATAATTNSSKRSRCQWNDFGYVIPQTSLPDETLRELVERLGEKLLTELYVGFFGLDLVVFRGDECDGYDENGELNYWVVDMDPYYTDLLSFDDWRRFCLNVPISASFSSDPSTRDCEDYGAPNLAELEAAKEPRFVVCSGKLYANDRSSIDSDALERLFKEYRISYSHKAKSGCMICPIDSERRSFLLFSFCRGRQLALRNFVRALKALHRAATQKRSAFGDDDDGSRESDMIYLARDMEKFYDIHDRDTLL